MDRDLWPGLVVFGEIVEARTFARAAKRLGLSASALSHTMRSLETRLGTRLLDRTTRSLAPTRAGEALLQSLRPAMASVESALAALNMARDDPAGVIRVNAHRPAAIHVIIPRLPLLAEKYPQIVVELAINDGLVDIVAERFDCGVRHEGALQADMVSIRISDPMPVLFVAAPSYLNERGVPALPDDLDRHRCICYRHTSSGVVIPWQFSRDDVQFLCEVPASFVTNDTDAMRDAALAGLGIACLLRAQAEPQLAAGSLVEVLPGWGPSLPANHAYYPSRRHPTAAFRAFLDVMRL